MSGRKKIYFESMTSGLNIISNINREKEYEKFMFFTSFGTVVGKPKELFHLELTNEKEIAEVLIERIKKKENVDAISIGNSLYFEQLKRTKLENPNTIDNDVAIPLEDVTITDQHGNKTETNILMLYFDQVIGFTPIP